MSNIMSLLVTYLWCLVPSTDGWNMVAPPPPPPAQRKYLSAKVKKTRRMWPDEYLCYEYGIVNVLYNIENIKQGKPKKINKPRINRNNLLNEWAKIQVRISSTIYTCGKSKPWVMAQLLFLIGCRSQTPYAFYTCEKHFITHFLS